MYKPEIENLRITLEITIMKIIHNSKIIFLFLASFIFLIACNPNISETTIYTSDFEDVKNGKVIEVPMKLSFQMIGDDADNSLEKSKNIAKNFLHPDSKFYITEGQFIQDFVVETFIPMIKAEKKIINTYFENNKNLVALYYHPKFTKEGSDKIELVFQRSFANSLNNELFQINPLLQFKFPANKMIFRVISDSKQEKKLGAYSVWVSKKPFITKTATLKRRQEIEFVFKGGVDSIYSNINPQIFVVNQ